MPRQRIRQRLGRAVATIVGWRVVVPDTLPERCVVIGAPHTSAWDLGLTLLLLFAADLRLRWIAKAELFGGLQGRLLRALGGIPVNRAGPGNFVAQMVAVFASSTRLLLAISPEGTRGSASAWKTGFYYIAQGAGVPIVLGYADYRRKIVGIGPTLYPSGDIQADFAQISAFYTGISGKYPAQQGPIQLAPLAEPGAQADPIA